MPKLSVIVLAYNHEKYISQALDSILGQQTDFDFELLIGEDDSQDKTREICRKYAKKFPDIIRLFENDRKNVIYVDGNATGRWNLINLLEKVRGQYLAMCEGDDYWNDDHKLQKMVDFMDRHDDYSVCFHRVQWLKNGVLEEEPYLPPADKEFYTADDLFLNDNFIRTSSVLYRNVLKGDLPQWFTYISFGDICLHLMHSQFGKIAYMDEVMGVYRVHESGIFSGEKPYVNIYKSIKTFAIAAENLGYTDRPSFKLGQARMLAALAQTAQKESQRLQKEVRQKAAQPAAPFLKSEKSGAEKNSVSPLVSVIVPTYNRPEGLKQALESIAAQTYPNIEAVVVNDAGQDVSNVIDRFKKRLKIKYIVHEKNKDLAGARNSGLKNASGSYIAYLDDDDLFFPNHIEDALRILTGSDYEVVYSDAFRLHQEEENGVYVTRHMDIPYSVDFDAERILKGNIAPVLTYVHARSCLDKAGYFDESLHTHEDWDFFIRLSRSYKFYHLKKLTCAFAWRYEGAKMTVNRREDFVRTTEIIYDRYARFAQHRPKIREFQKRHLANLKAAVKKQMKQGETIKKEFHGALVSIVIPLFNQLEYTQKCLMALFNNTIYAPYQVILVDNGSTDSTAKFVRELVGRYKMIKSIRNETNLGFAKACNQGARAADGSYIVFLNNDTEVQKYWLVNLLATAYNDPRVGAVGAKLLYPDGSIQHAGVIVTRDEQSGLDLNPHHIYYGKDGNAPEANVPYIYQALTGACLLVPREEFFTAGGFDEAYLNGYEDVDFCFQLGQMGKILVYQPRSVVIHYESKSGPERFAAMDKNREILYSKWLPLIRVDYTVHEDGQIEFSKPMKMKPYKDTPPIIQQTGKNLKPRISFLALERHEVACPVLRLAAPLQRLQQQNLIDYRPFDLVKLKMNWVPVEQLVDNDILIIQRNFVAEMPFANLEKMFGDKLPKIIYEFDDAFDRIPRHHPGHAYYKKMQADFKEYVRRADLVTVASRVQKEYYSHLNTNIVVIPNTVIDEIWRQDKKPAKRSKKRVSILFSGTNGHLKDFRLIESILERILTEYKNGVELLFWADIPTKLEKLPNFKRIAYFMDNYYDYATVLKSIDADFALVPLEYNDFNMAKTHIKWLEYSACAIPGIFSDIPAYEEFVQDYKTGIIVKNIKVEWEKAIRFMIDHPKERLKMARAAYKEVWSKHTLSRNLYRWQNAYKQLLNPASESKVSDKSGKSVVDRAKAMSAVLPGKAPRVSIIIPLFNKKEMTERCLDAIRKNTQYKNYEIILVDNGSTDGTKTYLKKIKQSHKYIRTILNKTNLGFAKANNQGAKQAEGEYILFLNNDTEVQPGWLSALVAVAEDNPKVGAVGSKLLFPDGTLQHAGVILVDDRLHGDPLLAMHNFYKEAGDKAEANRMMAYQALTAACVLVRRDVFEEVHGFDTGFWNGYEDVDLCFRIGREGYQLVYQPESVVIHYESKSGAERWKKVKENINRLHEKWLNKIQPDLIIEEDGHKHINAQSPVRPYQLLKKEKSVMNTKPETLVSIIILTFNALKYTKLTIRSILQHTEYPYELIIVDNASADGTRKYLRELEKEYDHISVIFNKKNKGFAAGNNQGAKKARGDYLFFLNNDVLVGEGWLSGMVRALEKDPAIGMVGPLTNRISGYQMVKKVPYKNDREFFEFAKTFRRKFAGNITPRRRIAGFAVLIRKELYWQVEGFDTDYGTGNYEDDDLCLKVRQKGYAIMVDEGTFIHHYGSQTFKANRIDLLKSLDEKESVFRKKWPNVDYEELLEMKNPLHEWHEELLQEGFQFLDSDNEQEAKKRFVHILQDNPLSLRAHFGLALVYKRLNQPEQAMYHALKMITIDPENALSYNQAGILFFEQQNFEEALQYFSMAIQKDASLLDAQRNYGSTLIEKGDYQHGVKTFQKILENHPSDIPTLMRMAQLFFEVEKYAQVEKYVKKVLELDAQNPEARQLMEYLSEKGKPTVTGNGEDEVQKILDEAAGLLENGNAKAAREKYTQIIENDQNNITALYGLSLCLRLEGDAENAVAVLKNITHIQPDFARAYNDLGIIAMEQDRLQQAVNYFSKGIELDPKLISARHYLSDVLIELGQFDEGVQLIMETLKEFPQDVDTLLRVGRIYFDSGEHSRARAYFEQVLQLDRDNRRAIQYRDALAQQSGISA